MSAPNTSGPFRDDARVERTAVLASSTETAGVLHRVTAPGIEMPTYIGVLAFSTIAMGLAVGAPIPSLPVGIMLGLLALGTGKQQLTAGARRDSTGSRARCDFTPRGLVVETRFSRTEYPYSSLTSVTADDRWVVLIMRHRSAVVIEAGADLADWVRARATNLSRAPFPRRVMLAVAALYVVLVAAIAIAFRTFTAS